MSLSTLEDEFLAPRRVVAQAVAIGAAPDRSPSSTQLGVRPIRLAFQQVADQLRELIVHGELGPGTRLPSEPELATQFLVSRSTIREALRMLSSQQLITTSRGVGGGSYITHPEPEAISRVLH